MSYVHFVEKKRKTLIIYFFNVQWTLQYMNESGSTSQVYRMTLASAVSSIWLEHNARMFQQKQKPYQVIIKQVINDAQLRMEEGFISLN